MYHSVSAFIVTWCSPRVHVCVQISPFYKDTSHSGLGFTLLRYDLILINYICDDLISKQGHILRSWGLGGQHMNFGGHRSVRHTRYMSAQLLGLIALWDFGL